VEVNGLYVIIRCWWLSLRVTYEASVHELANWLNFWHFHVREWGGFMVHVNISFMNFLWFLLSSVNSKLGIHSHLNSICILFPSLPPSLLWDYWFCWSSIPFICRSSVMKSGLICPLVISWKLSITSGCNNGKKLHLSIHNDVWWLRSCFQTVYII